MRTLSVSRSRSFPAFVCALIFALLPAVFASAAPVFPQPGSALNVVYLGDSITESSPLPEYRRPPVACSSALQRLFPAVRVYMSPQGHSGHTTVDFLPRDGGNAAQSDFGKAEEAARKLQTNQPGLLVFSIMLGTNDSAERGPNGSPVSPVQYGQNLKKIIGTLLERFPGCLVILHAPLWYSPNTENSSLYGEAGLKRLKSYIPVLAALPREFPSRQVRMGDDKAFAQFEAETETLQRPEEGRQGIFRLHPTPEGAVRLGNLWADAIAKQLSLR